MAVKGNILILLFVFVVSVALILLCPSGVKAAIDPIMGTPFVTSLPITPPIDPEPLTSLGDLNYDGVINIQDYILLSNAFGTNDKKADLNDDRVVNIQDYIILSNNFGKTNK